MRFLILGPLEVRGEKGAVVVGGIKLRAALAVLLLHANEAVSAERLALALWGEEAPGGATKTVQVHIWRLRKALGDPDLIATTSAGYCLRVRPDELDAARFEGLVEDGRRALAGGQSEYAAAVLREALALWRGPALAELAFEPFAHSEIARLEEHRLAALEARIEADLGVGRNAELVGELRRLVAVNPTRERLAAQLMLALYRCGRQTDALEVYQDTRRVLVNEIGVEPGSRLRELQEAILRQDVALQAGGDLPALPTERDTATVAPVSGTAGGSRGAAGPLRLACACAGRTRGLPVRWS
jgi:DNA-binding SARP family transcriptional activator